MIPSRTNTSRINSSCSQRILGRSSLTQGQVKVVKIGVSRYRVVVVVGNCSQCQDTLRGHQVAFAACVCCRFLEGLATKRLSNTCGAGCEACIAPQIAKKCQSQWTGDAKNLASSPSLEPACRFRGRNRSICPSNLCSARAHDLQLTRQLHSQCM